MIRAVFLAVLITGCGARAVERDEAPAPVPCDQVKKGPNVCWMEKGDYVCSHDRGGL